MDGYGYEYRRLVDSVSLLTPELLAEVGRMVVERGHRVAGKKPGAALRGRRHSFVAGTDVHHPTDRSLPGGRGAVHGPGRVPGLRRAGATRLAAEGIPLRKAPERLPPGGHVTARQPAPGGRGGAAPARPEAGGQGGGQPRGDRRQVGYPGPIGQYPGLHRPCQAPGGPDRTADPEGRDGPAPREGAPDIRAAHPLDIEGKGRGPGGARRPRPRAGDRHGFLLHRSVMWEGSDVDVAVPMGGEARARFPDLSVVSFDRGPRSPPDRLGPAGMPEPTRCPAGAGCRRRTAGRGAPTPPAGRPPATWHRGLDRVRSHGKKGFARTVALAVLAADVHRPGLMPPARERPVLPAAA